MGQGLRSRHPALGARHPPGRRGLGTLVGTVDGTWEGPACLTQAHPRYPTLKGTSYKVHLLGGNQSRTGVTCPRSPKVAQGMHSSQAPNTAGSVSRRDPWMAQVAGPHPQLPPQDKKAQAPTAPHSPTSHQTGVLCRQRPGPDVPPPRTQVGPRSRAPEGWGHREGVPASGPPGSARGPRLQPGAPSAPSAELERRRGPGSREASRGAGPDRSGTQGMHGALLQVGGALQEGAP